MRISIVSIVGSLLFVNKMLISFTAPEFKANRFSQPPVIDGYLNDPCWDEATRIDKDFRNWGVCGYNPDYGKIAPVRTVVLVGYDNENLYFGFICYEPEMDKIRAKVKNQNRPWEISRYNDDMVGIVLNTFVERKEGYWIYVNPNGIYSVGYLIEKKLYEYDVDILNIPFFTAGKILDTIWTVEIQIPFQSLRFPSTYIDYWRIDFSRHSPTRDELTYYHWVPRQRGISEYTYLARMYINDKIYGPKRLEFLPYVINGLTVDTTSNDCKFKIGFNAKYFLNYNNIIDFSFFPDFSQIETDAPQIDVNTTSALYYEEKRPFFLERKAFFETPLLVFYSRMINDPFGAIKYTGSIKDHSIGYIGGIDRHTPFIIPFSERGFSIASDKVGTSNILRLKKNLFVDTYFGFLTTDREIIEGGFNRLLGVDGIFTILSNNSVRYQGLLSWTKEPPDTMLFGGYGIDFSNHTARFDGEEFYGQGFFVEVGRKDKYLSLNCYVEGLSPTFRADNGYISYNDYTKFGFNASSPYGIKRYCVEKITPEIKFEQSHRYFGQKTEVSRRGSLSTSFKYLITTSLSYQMVDKFYRDMWFNDMWSYSASLSSYTLKFLSIGMFLNYGRSINYYSTPLSLGYNLYPYFWFDYNFGPVSIGAKYYQYLFWSQKFGEWIYNQKTFELNLSYTFTRFMGFRVIGQYNSSNKNLLIAPLFSFTPTPLTLFYLGANHNFNNETPLDIGGYEHTKSQIFLKVQYLFRH
ncbi:MAG: carbohydrate binding family 9 domain-containing protein [candidate division WOR-3 bacterium]